MPFLWDEDVSDIENAKRCVEYLIQTIENHNPTMEQVKGDLVKLRNTLVNTK